MHSKTTEIELGSPAVIAPQNDEIQRLANDFIVAGTAETTRRAYRSDWHHFEGWCAARGVAALPAAPSSDAMVRRYVRHGSIFRDNVTKDVRI